jgi:hypothetical protein
MQGRFSANNPQKYKGDPSRIYYRSSWELILMRRFDNDSNITEWSSEELVIPYRSPVDNKIHRYFPDFKIKTSAGQTLLIEVKPKDQVKKPDTPKKVTKAFLKKVMTWGVNQAKWEAANDYATDRKWMFKVLTEEDLGIKT